MYCYILALLLWVSCGLYVVLFHTYHNIHIICIITYILFYVVLHIGLAAMSLVWLVYSNIISYIFQYTHVMYCNIRIFLYVLLRIGLTAMSPVWLIFFCMISYVMWYQNNISILYIYTIVYMYINHASRVAGSTYKIVYECHYVYIHKYI